MRYLTKIRTSYVLCVFLFVLPVFAQNKSSSLWIEDLTWVELKTQIDAGHTTVILPTGGLEQNGPYITLAKHNHVVAYAAQEVATELGHTLIAPVLKVVPQGSMDKPTGNLLFPGTMALRDETFERVLQDMVLSLAYAGFKRVYLMGDHGQSQEAQSKVAAYMSVVLESSGVHVLSVQSYYQPDLEIHYLASHGIEEGRQGGHAGVADTAQIWAINPDAVRQRELFNEGSSNKEKLGLSGRPELATLEHGRALLALRIQSALAEIRRSFDQTKLIKPKQAYRVASPQW